MGLSAEVLKNKFICDRHFTENDFKTGKKKYLKTHVAPKKYIEEQPTNLKVKTPIKTYQNKHFIPMDSPPLVKKKLKFNEDLTLTAKKDQYQLEDILNLPDQQMTPRKIKLKNTIRIQTCKIRRFKKRIDTLKANARAKTLITKIMPLLGFLSAVGKTFLLMQLRGIKRKAWEQKEREFAISFFYKSPSAYVFLRKKGIILPSTSTLRRWIGTFKTGIDENIKQLLKLKCSSMNKLEKNCVLAFDEMSIKELLEYNRKLDIIEGFEDLGPLGRNSKTATHALVFSIRGLFKNWKMPFSYYFCHGSLNQHNLKLLIEYNLKNLFGMGYNPRAIVCDQGTNNRGAFKLLGVTSDIPYFFFDSHKIFGIFDVPHLFKSFRNNLLTGNFKYENKIIDFNIIKEVFEIDKKSASARVLTKITEAHLNPNNFQKMSCKLALQLFSKTVAAA